MNPGPHPFPLVWGGGSGTLKAPQVGAFLFQKPKGDRHQFGFDYRGIDSIYNEIQAVIARNGLIFIPQVVSLESEDRPSSTGGNLIYRVMKIRYWVFGLAGDVIPEPIEVIGEGMDSGDKAATKGQTAAEKVSLIEAFKIPTGDKATDPDHTTETSQGPAQAGGGTKWETVDRYRFDKGKGKPLTEGRTEFLVSYRGKVEKALGAGKEYASQEHLDAIDQELASRIEQERETAGSGAQGAPPCPDCGAQVENGVCSGCGAVGPSQGDDQIPF